MEIRPLCAGDMEQAWELDRDAFHGSEEMKPVFFSVHDPARLIGAFDGQRLVAMSGVHPFGQWFGGRRVSMGGLSSVSVAPDHRGRGLARQVVGACLDAMGPRGELISSLFPATTRLYRSLGWEVAGSFTIRNVAPRLLAGLPRPDGVDVRPATPDDFDAIRACYDGMAREVNGFVDRSERWWTAGRDHILPRRSVYLAEVSGKVAGYVIYRQTDGEHSALGGPFRIAVEDLVWHSRDAGLALWRLIASWATQVSHVVYRGGAEDPLLLLAPQQDSETVGEIRWMTRIVDVEGAIAARGFAPGLELETPFSLADERFSGNQGCWTLCVRDGRGWLEKGGSGGPQFDVGSFSSLYTGWAGTAALARAGRMSGGTADERAQLDAAFSGQTPWMLNEF